LVFHGEDLHAVFSVGDEELDGLLADGLDSEGSESEEGECEASPEAVVVGGLFGFAGGDVAVDVEAIACAEFGEEAVEISMDDPGLDGRSGGNGGGSGHN